MSLNLEDILVVYISATALFDLSTPPEYKCDIPLC